MDWIEIDFLQRRPLAGTIVWLTVAIVAAAMPTAPVRADDPDTAQWLLFDNPYLAAISPPAELAYRFEHSTADAKNHGEPFADEIRIEVGPPDEKHTLNSVTLDIFTESRNRRIGPLADVSGNPVIMVFLERDVFHMQARTPASLAFLRNTIRKAMREDAEVENVDIDFDGKTVAGKRVTIAPFADQNGASQFAEFRDKTYNFTVSKAVPGGIYEIVSVLPNRTGPDETPSVDRLVFTARSVRP